MTTKSRNPSKIISPKDDFFDDLEEGFSSSFEIRKHTKSVQNIYMYISKAIGAPHQYIELIDTLRNAHPTDTIFIHLNTPGGQLDTGVQIIHAIRECPGRVVTVLDGSVCSMGSLIFLAASEYIVHDNCQLMFHNYSGGFGGKGHEVGANFEATNTWFNGMMEEICIPFLTEQELVDIIQGKDLWLSSDDTRVRLQVVVEALEAEMLEMEQEELEAQEKEVLKRIQAREKKLAKLAAKNAITA